MSRSDGEVARFDEPRSPLVCGVDRSDTGVECAISLEDLDVGVVFRDERRITDDISESKKRAVNFARDEVSFHASARDDGTCNRESGFLARFRNPLRRVEEAEKWCDDTTTRRADRCCV